MVQRNRKQPNAIGQVIVMHIKSEHLYKILLNPQDFAQYLYTCDPVVSCGFTGDNEGNPLGQFIAHRLYELAKTRGTCVVTDVATSFSQWEAPYTTLTALNPPWVHRFNRSLRRLSGGEHGREIWPGTALSRLGAALDCEFPGSPFAGAEVYWPCYTEGEDDPRDRPYELVTELNDWQYIEATVFPHEKILHVIMWFGRGLLRKNLTFQVPNQFPLHHGFETAKRSFVTDLKVTQAMGWRESQYILTFDNGQRLAVPNQRDICTRSAEYSDIPF